MNVRREFLKKMLGVSLLALLPAVSPTLAKTPRPGKDLLDTMREPEGFLTAYRRFDALRKAGKIKTLSSEIVPYSCPRYVESPSNAERCVHHSHVVHATLHVTGHGWDQSLSVTYVDGKQNCMDIPCRQMQTVWESPDV